MVYIYYVPPSDPTALYAYSLKQGHKRQRERTAMRTDALSPLHCLRSPQGAPWLRAKEPRIDTNIDTVL